MKLDTSGLLAVAVLCLTLRSSLAAESPEVLRLQNSNATLNQERKEDIVAPEKPGCNEKAAVDAFFADWCNISLRNVSTSADFRVQNVFKNGTASVRDKSTWLAVLSYLCASFPDFNVDYKGEAILEPDGFYHIPNEQHNGRFTGVPFSPPGSTLPKLQPTGQFFSTAAFEGRVLVDKATCLVSEYDNLGTFEDTGPYAIYRAIGQGGA